MIQSNYQQLMAEGAMPLVKKGFTGNIYRVSNFWTSLIPVPLTGPIVYLEIGTYYGANAISMLTSYCKDPESKIYCVDPWSDYSGLAEEEHKNETIYDTFIKNVKCCQGPEGPVSRGPSGIDGRFNIIRDTSSNVVPTLPNKYFDMIYIDGNHNPEYVIEDAVLSFRKLKTNGYLIFDDYGWADTNIGINAFLDAYKAYVNVLGIQNCQLYLQKIKDH